MPHFRRFRPVSHQHWPQFRATSGALANPTCCSPSTIKQLQKKHCKNLIFSSHPCKAAPSSSFYTFPWSCSGKTPNRVWSLMGFKVLLVQQERLWGGSRSEVSALCQAHHTFPGVLLLIMQIVSWILQLSPNFLSCLCLIVLINSSNNSCWCHSVSLWALARSLSQPRLCYRFSKSLGDWMEMIRRRWPCFSVSKTSIYWCWSK